MKYQQAFIACIEHQNGTFANGRQFLYSAPFATEALAQSWADAFTDVAKLIRIETSSCPGERIVGN